MREFLKRNPKRPRLSRSFIASYLLVVVPIMLITNLLFYLFFVPVYRKDIQKMNTNTIQNIQLTFERFVIEPLDNLYISLVSDRPDKDFMFPTSQHAYGDMWKLLDAHRYLREEVLSSNGLLSSISFYFDYERFVLSSLGFSYLKTTETSRAYGWLEALPLSGAVLWAEGYDLTVASKNKPVFQPAVYYMKAYPLQAEVRKATVIFALNTEYLESLLQSLLSNKLYTLALYNAHGQSVFQMGQTQGVSFSDVAYRMADDGSANTISFGQSGTMNTAIHNASRSLYYVFSLPCSQYFQATDLLITQLVILMFTALAASIMFSLLMAKRMYKPIRTIAQTATLLLHTSGADMPSPQDSYQNIQFALTHFSGRTERLQTTLDEFTPMIRCNFYRDLLLHTYQSPSEIDEKCRMLNIHPRANYNVLIIKVMSGFSDRTYAEMFKLSCLNYFNQYECESMDVYALLGENDTIIVIAAFDAIDVYHTLCEDAHTQIRLDYFKAAVPARISSGLPTDDICGMHVSFSQAQKALEYGFLTPHSLLNYARFSSREEQTKPCVFLEANKVQKLIYHLSQESCLLFCEELTSYIHSTPISIRQIRSMLIQIVQESLSLAQKRGVFLGGGLERQWMEVCANAPSLDDFCINYRSICAELMHRFDQKATNQNYDLISRVQVYIQAHLCENLTLNTVSEAFHLSYSYLSKLFKEVSGINYSEFLLNCRMEEAARLLLETDWTLEEISNHLTLSNAGYLIRIFKNRYGQTPRQYRLSHQGK